VQVVIEGTGHVQKREHAIIDPTQPVARMQARQHRNPGGRMDEVCAALTSPSRIPLRAIRLRRHVGGRARLDAARSCRGPGGRSLSPAVGIDGYALGPTSTPAPQA
jgi:hypothetical protein